MAKSQEMTTPKSSALVPEFLRNKAGRGTEDFEAGSYEFPRIKLLQGISPELQTFDGLKAGDFFHTMTEESLGPQLDIVPLYMPRRFVLWAPLPPIDHGGILARADDGVHWNPPDAEFRVKIDKRGTEVTWRTAKTVSASRLDQWGTYDPSDSKSQPAATECYMLIVHLLSRPDVSPVAILLQRSSIGPARGLRGKLKFTPAPMYGCRFIMSSFLDANRAGQQFNNYRFSPNGFIEDEDEVKRYEQLYESFRSSNVQMRDLEEAHLDDPAPAAGNGARGAGSNEDRF